jgi:hypothetical protein
MSALSTTAIKDGHRGNPFAGASHHHLSSTNTLDAERADRISRLPGLERVGTVRANQTGTGGSQGSAQGPQQNQLPGYFDAAGNPIYTTKMSTVGSASATDSASQANTTTWASASGRADDDRSRADDERSEPEQMMDMDMGRNYRDIDERDRYEAMDQSEDGTGDGMSEEGNASLVGFGEGAGSTVSGPTYTRRSALLQATGAPGAPSPATGGASMSTLEQRRDGRMAGGSVDDNSSGGFVDTISPGPRTTAERIVKERLDEGESKLPPMSTPDEAGLGKFYFERK